MSLKEIEKELLELSNKVEELDHERDELEFKLQDLGARLPLTCKACNSVYAYQQGSLSKEDREMLENRLINIDEEIDEVADDVIEILNELLYHTIFEVTDVTW